MTWTATIAAVLAATFAAAPLSAQPAKEAAVAAGGWTSQAMLEALAAEAQRACSAPGASPPHLDYGLVSHARWLAGLEQRGTGAPCTPRPVLALRIARAAANSLHPRAADAYRLLAELHEGGLGTRRDPTAAREHRRRAWAIGDPAEQARPFASGAAADAWLSAPPTIAFLRRYAAAESMTAARVRLARALLVPRATLERGREALALLPATTDGGGLYWESQLLRHRIAIESGDETARALGTGALRALARYGGPGDVADYLAGMAQGTLSSPNAKESRRREAIAWLADAAYAQGSPHRAALLRAVSAANGGFPPGTLTGEAARAARRRLQLSLTPDDYPAHAMRAEDEGHVLLRGLIDPDGWLIYTEPRIGGQPQDLLDHVRRLYAGRRLPPVDRSAAPGTPYVWVNLPVFQFRLQDEGAE
ncbi:MAG TPA: hypothetical protein VGB79_17435 [Allosphingosinicella sp.]|jgi:hypothetical protein